jgi:hypothetical protein
MNRKPFLVALAELLAAYWPRINLGQRRWLRWLLPTPGNVLFTLLVVGALLWAASVGALPLRAPAAAGTSTGTIAYQGRLADANGSPLTGTYNMIFRLYDAASGGTPLWTEQWTGSNGVKVSDGLFNVMLGSLTPIPTSLVTDHSSLFLGITVGTDDEMTPRVQLGSVPFAVQALTVPDGSVTTAKIADGAVTTAKLSSQLTVPFEGRPGSYPYIVGMGHFLVSAGNYCWGYMPTEHPNPDYCPVTDLNDFLDLNLLAYSADGHIHAANNTPGRFAYGYVYAYFLTNSGAARTINVDFSTCNDVGIYVMTGAVNGRSLGTAGSKQYHRTPGNTDGGIGCPCADLTASITIPSGAFRLIILTRGSDCTSYLIWPTDPGNWIADNSLSVDWDGLRTYFGEK